MKTKVLNKSPQISADGQAVTSVDLRIDGLMASLAPALEGVKELLQCTRRHIAPRGPLGHSLLTERVPFAALDLQERLCFPAGLVPRIMEFLADKKIQIRLTRSQEREEWLSIDQMVVAGTRGPGRAILGATQADPVGRIVLQHRHQLPMFLGLICRAYRKAQIVLAVRTLGEARRLAWLIEKTRQIGFVELFTGRGMRYPSRVTVTTYNRLPSLYDPFQTKDILLAVEPAMAVGRMGDIPVWKSQICASRTYSFEVGIRRPDSYPDFLVEAMAGRIIHSQLVQMYCIRINLPPLAVPYFHPSLNNLQRQQQRWHDRRRNSRIAAVAVALAVGDAPALRRQGIQLAELDALRSPRRTILLVESLEQGRELQRHLPGWPLCFWREGSPPSLPEVPVLIITAVCAHVLRPFADVVLHTGDGDPTMFVRPSPSPFPKLAVVSFESCRRRRLISSSTTPP